MKKLKMVVSPAPAPSPYLLWSPSPTAGVFNQSHHSTSTSSSKLPIDFSPPLIAMVVVVATAFLIVTYLRLISHHVITPFRHRLRQWRLRHRRHPSSIGDMSSPPFFDPADGFHVFSPYGLDESVIKTIPLSIYSMKSKKGFIDCAVCLLEFEDNDYVRTLPVCSHAFHVDCIDIWLRSHANCPLCRAGIFRPESPFIPLMAATIRPSLDDGILDSILLLEPLNETAPESPEISPVIEEPVTNLQSEDRFNDGRNMLLKRSYSFGFERNFPSERLVEPGMMTSPRRYWRGSFRSKRPSPFGKPRVFSFRSYRGMTMKSPFFRRRSFFPMSESSSRYSTGYGGGSGGYSRRSKSLTSPMFSRPSGLFSSSRMRCGDPEALLSPERYNRR